MKKSVVIYGAIVFIGGAVSFQNCAESFRSMDTVMSKDRSLLIDRMDAILKNKAIDSIYVTTDNYHPNDELQEGVTPKRPLLHFFSQGNSQNVNSFIQMANSNSNGTAFSSDGSSRFENCGNVSADNQLWVYTYGKPYMLSQSAYLTWIKSLTAKSSNKLDDFLPPKARSFNEWLGNKSCPISSTVASDATETESLKKSFGQSISKGSDDSIALTLDNRYNPYRWVVPFNETHHIEAPSMAFLRRSTPEERLASETALANYISGPKAGAVKQASVGVDEVYLDYDFELSVVDHSSLMKEYQYSDILSADISNDFLSALFFSAKNYGNTIYFNKRMVPKTFQFSLMVNWAEVGGTANSSGLYRLSEIMMVSQNYQSVLPADSKLVPTDKTSFDFNPYIVEGGANAVQAWYRAHADGYHNFHQNRGSDYGNLYPFSSDFRHQQVENTSPIIMKGSVNISKFYKLLRDGGLFPGQQFNPNESHRIHWIGAIFEAHGPYEVHLKIRKMNLSIQKAQEGAIVLPSDGQKTVFRLKSLADDYLYTVDSNEVDTATKSGYVMQGAAFKINKNPASAADKPLLRCRIGSTHFLSTELNCEGQIAEGVLGYVSTVNSSGMIRIQRYSKSGSYITVLETNQTEIAAVLKAGYRLDGPQGFVFP